MREIHIGDTAKAERMITSESVEQMAELTRDYNPIHMDESYAKRTRFGRRIAHGLFCESLISAILGNDLPGEGTIIVSQNFRFIRPVYIGDRIKGVVTVISINQDKGNVVLECECINQTGVTVVEGRAVVLLDCYSQK